MLDSTPPPTVLIVEDDPALQSLLVQILKMEAFEVIHAGTGADALDVIDHQRPDVLILDYQLPDMTGDVLLATMRSRGFNSPVVLSTAHPNAQFIFRNIEAQGLLMKPFDPIQLVTLVRSLIAVRLTTTEGS
jgi:DNA-binding response OmpR family regulator